MTKNDIDPFRIEKNWPGSSMIHNGKKFKLISVPVETREGKTYTDLIVHPGASVILPLLSQTEVILIKNKRLSIQDTLLELPAGTICPPEKPVDCAKRELIEETGYKANKIEPLGDFYPAPGFCTEQLFAFIAHDLEYVGQSLDPEENIEVEIYKLRKVYNMIEKGHIKDAKTISTFFLYMKNYSYQ
ncbi:MAG: NUDIX hydrolase [Desulfobacula sp.]|jgi:ADP-ribose pyrophosphatase|uniref:NUDIX hydrolase n=1 Tax=Desulfobacula sp. TaxID=2593537 RepID=UPI001DC92B4F|nr:NUDIX hydrolase [Desulfobacula sp.]MBT4024975.1 NUDIX hydrolase [Desulfobacula sp.]MBT4198793.1 NUDIX hydrolase [Desulfobacula sp.]MBT4508672.1 NUDIX hydrolase [Desulfobacula sp.]MBT5544877.1 NUDIX hydrolase [Desulfobacula sp.]